MVLFLIYISDINSYLPHGTGCNTEKYADDIISYIIDKDVRSQLPQEIVDAVQRWCDDKNSNSALRIGWNAVQRNPNVKYPQNF